MSDETCEWCDRPVHFGGTACIDHKKDSTGVGDMLCGICGEPQKFHSVGYPEHSELRDDMRIGRKR